MSPLNSDALEISLKEEDMFITEVINTIPPKMYFDKEVQEKIVAERHAHVDETMEGLQEGSRRKKASAKAKHKRARLDPQYQKSVSQIQEEISEKANKKSKKKVTFKSASLTRADNIEELQKMLHEKVHKLQAMRRGCSPQELLDRKQLKKEKKKLKSRQRGNFSKAAPTPIVQNSKPQEPVKRKVNTKPMYNKDGNVMFSKFEFSANGLASKKDGAFSGKNYKKLLNSVEMEKEKINKLKEEDKQKADEFVRKKAWKRAIEKAEGVKVKDDSALLKKSLVKQEKKKCKNAKVWKEREEHMGNKKKVRQEKRQKNIQNKKREKLHAKLKRAKRKGRIIPGF